MITLAAAPAEARNFAERACLDAREAVTCDPDGHAAATALCTALVLGMSLEDVNDFLQRIKELGDRRDQEDEERNKKLEEEILQGRKERQARRAGRSIPNFALQWKSSVIAHLVFPVPG